jgi:4-hydroxy-tetrahydrodipicolinate synthase
MLPATVVRLSQLPGIVAVKEAVTEPGRVRALVDACRKDFVVLSGDDATARRSFQEGSRGVISVTANVAPRGMADVVAAGVRGDYATAEKLDAPLAALHRDLFIEANPIPTKWALARMGLIGEGIRLPLTPLSAASQPAVLAALQGAGVLPAN